MPGSTRSRRWAAIGALLLALALAAGACSSATAPDRQAGAEGAPGAWQRLTGALGFATATPTATSTATATATALPTVTPTPTPQSPLSIAAMRSRSYPGSPIVVEQELAPGNGYRRQVVSYRSEGLRIQALLTIPQGERPESGWPVVVFNHGYISPQQYRTTERYVAYVDAFARNGYLVIKPDYRGHGESEGRAEGGYGSPAYTVDVLNALASVRRDPDADPNRVGMWGHSMGGQITLRAMVVTDTIRAGVIWGGVVASYPDLMTLWHRPRAAGTGPTPSPRGGGWRQSLVAVYGTPEENPAFWASISPISYVADISGPVQLHHGTADTSVPPIFSELLRDQLQAAGKPVEYYSYPGDDHNLSANLATALQRSVDFFDRYVKNG